MDDFSRNEPVLGQPIVPMLGYANIARANQRTQLSHKPTHTIPPLPEQCALHPIDSRRHGLSSFSRNPRS